jgi:hypothetical protein
MNPSTFSEITCRGGNEVLIKDSHVSSICCCISGIGKGLVIL